MVEGFAALSTTRKRASDGGLLVVKGYPDSYLQIVSMSFFLGDLVLLAVAELLEPVHHHAD